MSDTVNTQLTVNGKQVRVDVPPKLTLLRFLRDYLGLTGTKNGCASGHCGACTVILNGKARRSCLVRMEKADGAVVETIEGLATGDRLHPLQQAFVEYGAVQCGLCIPGMIMTAKALLDAKPDPSRQEIVAALSQNRNICRCTGYVKIIDAVEAAAAWKRAGGAPPRLSESALSGSQLPRYADEKATGRTQYGDDIYVEGMLHGKILWAAYPHAEILSIDTKEAESMPGVVLVITARDIPGKNQAGNVLRDQVAIAGDKVRYIGDGVAAVFAETPEIAEQALDKILVEYKVLPGVFSVEEAAQPDAPKVQAQGNLLHHAEIVRGDVEQAFARCDVVIEDTYRTPIIEHGFLEPECGLGFVTDDGGVTIHVPSQTVFDDRAQLAEILDLPEEKIRVVQLPQGGSFGGKEDMILQQYLALGALLCKRPVKMVLTREESLRVHVKRHQAKMRYKTGCDAQGNLLAVESEIHLDTGCYASLGVDVLENTLVFGAGPYFVPNLKLQGWSWYTNNVPAGAMRGFGVNQVVVALEQQMDRMARAIGMDPFEFRLKNALDVGLPTAADHLMEEGLVSIKQTLEAARKAFKQVSVPKSRGNKRLGVGVASAVKNVGFGHAIPESTGAIVELEASGKVTLRITHHEYGQGAWAAQAQFVVEELGVPVERIEIVGPDTARTPRTGASTASRQTFMTGKAVLAACRALKENVFGHAAETLETDPGNCEFFEDRIRDRVSGREMPLADVIGDRLVVERRYDPPRGHPLLEGEASKWGQADFESRWTHWCYAFNTQVAVVEVDLETGATQVLTIVSANDVGRVLRPQAIEGQIQGGVMQGVGYALAEEYVVKDGYNQTTSLRAYGLPTIDLMPLEIIPVIVEVPHPFGPSGVKGFAEAPSMATAPAILNAIHDATGVRVTQIPASPKRLKTLLGECT